MQNPGGSAPDRGAEQAHQPQATKEITAPQDDREAKAKAEKEKRIKERQQRKATIVAKCIARFLARHGEIAAQLKAEADAARRAAEEAARLRKGKKGKKGKKKSEKGEKGGGKGKKGKKSPLAECWKMFIDDINEQISKNKVVAVEDIHRALSKLEPHQVKELIALVKAEGGSKKMFPAGQMNELLTTIKLSVFMAAASEEYTAQPLAPPEKTHPRALLDRGVSACTAAQMGFRARELVRGGYTKDQVTSTLASFREANELGMSVEKLAHSGFLPEQGSRREIEDLKAAGYTAQQMKAASFGSAWQYRQAGYSLTEMAAAGFTECGLRCAGFGRKLLQPRY